MADHSKKEFPRYFYHPKKSPDGRVFQTVAEIKSAGRGWVDSKLDLPKPTKISVWLKEDFKPWIDEWKWLFKIIAAVISAVAAITFFASKFTV